MARMSISSTSDGALRGYPANHKFFSRHQAGTRKLTTADGVLDERGGQTWHYLETDEQVKKWPLRLIGRRDAGVSSAVKRAPAGAGSRRRSGGKGIGSGKPVDDIKVRVRKPLDMKSGEKLCRR